ncbi:MAG: hypothetical protein ACJA1W_002303, partial [Akkermansiaceae bacterium]
MINLEINSSSSKILPYLERLVSNTLELSTMSLDRQGQSLQATLKRGWYFGAQEFREKLLSCLETEKA